MQKRERHRIPRILSVDQDWLCCRVIFGFTRKCPFPQCLSRRKPSWRLRDDTVRLSLEELQVVGRLVLLPTGVQKELFPEGSDGFLLVILHQLGQGGVLQLVHTQEAVGVRRSIYEEMFAAVLRQVGQGIASDLLTDSDQKTARHTCAQKVICSLYCENPVEPGSYGVGGFLIAGSQR